MDPLQLRIAVCCSSNMNTSMEAHARLHKKGFNVFSFGTGDKVKMPGPSISQPNIYEFGTSYDEIYQDLSKKDKVMFMDFEFGISFLECFISDS